MFRFLLLFFFASLTGLFVSAQTTADTIKAPAIDSIPPRDSSFIRDSVKRAAMADSVSRQPVKQDTGWRYNTNLPLLVQALAHHPYYNYNDKPVWVQSSVRVSRDKDTLFYIFVSLLIVFALLKLTFAKYFNDLFRLFFRTTLKQRQIRDQLIQTPLASLFFNAFYVAIAGLYIDYLFFYFDKAPVEFWLLYLYCCAGLSIIYFVKFIGLKIAGWLLNLKDAADSYIFIVFIVNKVIGIFLLPFVILLAFTDGLVFSTSLLLSWCGLGILFLYRFILAYSALRNQVRFNLFHFLLYFCAFELAPLLLIYRLLLLFIR